MLLLDYISFSFKSLVPLYNFLFWWRHICYICSFIFSEQLNQQYEEFKGSHFFLLLLPYSDDVTSRGPKINLGLDFWRPLHKLRLLCDLQTWHNNNYKYHKYFNNHNYYYYYHKYYNYFKQKVLLKIVCKTSEEEESQSGA